MGGWLATSYMVVRLVHKGPARPSSDGAGTAGILGQRMTGTCKRRESAWSGVPDGPWSTSVYVSVCVCTGVFYLDHCDFDGVASSGESADNLTFLSNKLSIRDFCFFTPRVGTDS